MPRIPVHTLETAPSASLDGLKVIHDRFGKILNLQGEMAHAPIVLKAYLTLKQVIQDDGTLDARTREAIALTVAAVNGCHYCQAAHTLGGLAVGLTDAQTVAIRRGTVDFDPKLSALLDLVRDATERRGEVSDETWQAALDAGWTDADLAEAHVHIVANVFTNFFNRLIQTDLDLPVPPPLDEG
jgi:AhpD family alkylhydroperoxidase